MILGMFPGQGSQYVGMGSALIESFPYVKEIFEEAEEGARFSIRKLCFDGPESDLKLTMNTQPCLLAVSTAYHTVLKKELDFKPDIFAGHSLGEYSAVVASGRLSILDAARLVRSRGQFMQDAVPAGVGAMAAVMNCPAEELEEICQEISSLNGTSEIANYNSPKQIVIAGHREAVEKAQQKLQEKYRVVLLPVSAPFHTSLMAPARQKMQDLLLETKMSESETPVIANLTGTKEVNYSPEFLIKQIDNPVKWTQSLECASEIGIKTFVEIGPGKVLLGLARKTLKGITVIPTDDIKTGLEKIASL